MHRFAIAIVLLLAFAASATAAEPRPTIKLHTSDDNHVTFEVLAETPIHRPAPEHFKLMEVGGEDDLLDFGERGDDFPRLRESRVVRYNQTWRGARLKIEHDAGEKQAKQAAIDEQSKLPLVDLDAFAKLAHGKQYELTWACWPIGAAKAIEVTCKFDLKDAEKAASGKTVSLELKADKTTIKCGEEIRWTAALVNAGKHPITLVQPGDGSLDGWRTPIIAWQIDGQGPRGKRGRCGNINSLAPDELIVLAPGQRRKLSEWIESPGIATAGKQQVTLTYANRSALRWRGVPLGEHDPATMEAVRSSDRVTVESNAVEITLED